MTIIKLVMELDKGYRFNPEETSYHIDEITADNYKEHQMRENPEKYTGVFWMSGIEVNEKAF